MTGARNVERRAKRCMILVAVCVFARSIWADAWTQPAGHGQVIWNSTFTDISHEFDGSGKITLFGDGGKFRKLEINPYFEYGLNASTSLVVNAFLPALNYSNNYRSSSSFGLGDVEAGVRRRLNPTESAFAVSTQFTVLFPTYSADRNPAPGNHQVDVETRLMAGRGFEVRRHHNFLSIGAAYRYRNGPPADQIRTDATWGIDVTGRLMAMAQYSGITGMRNGKPLEALDNPNLQSDFDLYKGQISLVVRITPKTRIQCGWIDAFAGRNTGHGETALVAIWRSF